MPETDLVVLGGGPGGYPAAFAAADRGIPVTLVDDGERPGGVCLHRGCIPSKALLHVARLIHETREAADWGVAFTAPSIDLDKLRGWKTGVIDQLTGGIGELCKARGVKLIQGRGVFKDAHTLAVRTADGATESLSFRHAVVSTGSSPVIPEALHVDDPRVMDSTGALELTDVPQRLLVVGGGYIGLEMGTVYAALGSSVTVVEMTGGLLPGVDRDLVNPLKRRLDGQFESIGLNTRVEKLGVDGEGIVAELASGDATESATFDRVLIAVGRRPNSANIGLEQAGVATDERGFVTVDGKRRTNAPHIMAIGDVAGEPMLAHKATHEAKIAIEALAGEPALYDPAAIPAVVFTDPEVAWCGLTETEAKAAGQAVDVFRFPWAASGRATTLGRTDGVTKLIAEPETGRLLGVGIVGVNAGELIAEGVVAIEMGATAEDLAECIHAHPTLSETILESAEGLLGHATHVFRRKR
ncbi:MAG: dihydrolipoyl dehydrogenase [Planctomycetaceae bacterium]